MSAARHRIAALLALSSLGAAGLAAPACSSSSDPPAGAAPEAGLDASLAVACTEAIDAIYGDPGALTGDLGTVLKCAPDRVWPVAELEAYARANAYPYTGKPFTSGARAYRVTYKTERGTVPPSPGYSSAILFVPDSPSANAPAVVFAHGTAGQAAKCAPSKHVYDKKEDAYAAALFPLVGAGYPVIMPDYAGYANYGAPNNPPSGYAASEDVGKSTLDGLRALRRMLPGVTSDKSIIVGHSQGGHSALSALAIAESYGVNVSGVVTYSPLWFNQATWGALLAESSKYPIETTAFPVAVGIWYLYSHGELQDGPGHGVDVFEPSKRAAIKQFFDTSCEADPVKALGTYPADLYDPLFVGSIKLPAATGSPCGNALCEKWVARYAADRPHLVGKAKDTPQLVLYGSTDTTIPPDRATCGFARLRSDGAKAKICVVPAQSHSGIVGARSAYTNDWIANIAQGAPPPDPGPCADDETSLRAGDKTVECANPPPND